MNKEITDEKLEKYFSITKEALGMVNANEMDDERLAQAKDFLDMATRYYQDAKHFKEQGDYVLPERRCTVEGQLNFVLRDPFFLPFMC